MTCCFSVAVGITGASSGDYAGSVADKTKSAMIGTGLCIPEPKAIGFGILIPGGQTTTRRTKQSSSMVNWQFPPSFSVAYWMLTAP